MTSWFTKKTASLISSGNRLNDFPFRHSTSLFVAPRETLAGSSHGGHFCSGSGHFAS